jgi:solute carrier family 25 protein 44
LGYKDDMDKKPSHMEMVTVQATAGMVAGACSSVITTPLDTVKTRLQVILCFHCNPPNDKELNKDYN